MTFELRHRADGHPRLVVEGPLTVDNVVEFRSLTDALVGERAVIVDLENCSDLDAAGLGALIRCVRRVHEHGGRIVIAADARSPLPRRLQHAGVSRLAPVIARPVESTRAA